MRRLWLSVATGSRRRCSVRKSGLRPSDIVCRLCESDANEHHNGAFAARLPDVLGRAERSSPNATQRRAKGAGLDSEGADRAIICSAVMHMIVGHCPKVRIRIFTCSAGVTEALHCPRAMPLHERKAACHSGKSGGPGGHRRQRRSSAARSAARSAGGTSGWRQNIKKKSPDGIGARFARGASEIAEG
jgi:hypothetical protein